MSQSSRIMILQALLLFLSCAPSAQRARLATSSPEAADLGQPLPDVVIIVLDDVGDIDIDASIPQATTNIRALAQEGVRFRRAYTHAWCAPTRDSWTHSKWLGQYRGSDCSLPNTNTIDPTDFNIVRMFEAQGYYTCHFGKWHLGTQPNGVWELTPQSNGYDRALCEYPVGEFCELPSPGGTRVDDGVVSQDTTNDTIALRDAFLGWWETTESPRFAVINFTAAHSPFKFPPPSTLPPGYPHPFNSTNRQKYEAEIAGVDTALGQLLPLFGPEDWVVFTSDNGTPSDVALPTQDPNKLKLTCYEGGIRVPLIVRGPTATPGLESLALVQLVDLLPTFASILGITTQVVDGLSFFPALTGGVVSRHFSFSYSPNRLDNAMVEAQWKLLTRMDGVEELYDLVNDPNEVMPLPPTGAKANYLRTIRTRILNGQSVLQW